MNRIIIHWTAGAHYPNSTDLKHYHYIIDKDGNIHNGNFKPEDNLVCTPGTYAEHTGKGNTSSIGISMCGMYNFTEKDKKTPYPLTRIQCEACFKLCAELAKKYNIPLDYNHIYTHYTFNKTHNIHTGKIDIIYLPEFSHVLKEDIIRFIISKIKWYQSKI